MLATTSMFSLSPGRYQGWFWQETEQFELASNEWKRSDARDVTQWFDDENSGRARMRRMVGSYGVIRA